MSMRQRLLHLALAGLAVLLLASGAEARGRRGGCGGGGGRCGGGGGGCSTSYRGGCGGGGCYTGGGYGGGCGGGSCGGGYGGHIGGSYCGGGHHGVGGFHQGHHGHADLGYGATMIASTAAPANLVVTLPAEARLTIDGHQTTSTSGERTFVTPNLPQGQEFHYTLTAEVMRDGQMQTITRRVTVRAGQETRVQLDVPAVVASR
jgi:uncharacterized protein (TIGR03000 family)